MSSKNKKTKKSNNQSSKFIFWVIGLIAFCLVGLIFLSNTAKKEAMDYDGQPVLGEKSAPVKIVEFGDYKCPYCKNFNDTLFPNIEKDFIDTGKASFYFMNYSFINVDSTRSAKFAETVFNELGNETFWKFHELLYDKQPDDPKAEQMDIYTEAFLNDTLSEIVSEAEVKRVVNAFNNDQSKEAWEKDMSAANKLSITSTPSIFINGVKFEGNTYNDFKKRVDEAANEE
ncbi:thioredoxin domain-containing protein [Neobacillus sp. SuZ13]|uniref:DsbA family protein n=1 Tax=Neobacillus sp. SuZ13 TaxID=3047875 RepID=UPI0024BF544A|nr:thioredoxin domain-containing protein [Neobacillus sp. SuZ13]WHY66507.1 thioredoxin domain-containing protein [Neobacillus sp. SuZ13]